VNYVNPKWETRLEADPWDTDAWTSYIMEAQTKEISSVRHIYERFLIQFPTAVSSSPNTHPTSSPPTLLLHTQLFFSIHFSSFIIHHKTNNNNLVFVFIVLTYFLLFFFFSPSFSFFLFVVVEKGRYWKYYVEQEIAANNIDRASAIFTRCLKNCPNIDLWKTYTTFIKQIKDEQTEADAITKAFEYALENMGMDIASTPIWTDYINFLKEHKVSLREEKRRERRNR
jgi:hypothetical protein